MTRVAESGRARFILAGIAILFGLGAVLTNIFTSEAADVTWLEPSPGTTLTGKVTLRVSAPDNTMMVYFKVGSERIGIDKQAPFEWTLDTSAYAPGKYRLRAAAYSGSKQLGTADLNVQFAKGGSNEKPAPVEPTDPVDDGGHENPAPEPEPEEPTSPGHGDHGEHLMDTPGACGESPRYWHPPVINGCRTGHEHGDDPDPYGYFKAAGAPDMDFLVLHELTMAHDGHHEVGGGYKIQYLDGGTPKDPSDDIRHAYHQVSSARNTGYFTDKFVRDRDTSKEHTAYHSVQVQVLAKNSQGKLVFTDVKWVDKVSDLHTRPSAGSPFDKQDLMARHDRDPKGVGDYIRNDVKKESWYWSDWESDQKEGLPLPLWNYILVDRILDSPTYEGKDPWKDYYTCDAQGGDHTKAGCWATGTLRWTDKMQFRVFATDPGVYWTNIYGTKVLGTGETKPKACSTETCVRQDIGALVKRDYIGWPNSPMGDHILRLYDAPGIVYPN